MATLAPPAPARRLDGGKRSDVASIIFVGALWLALTIAALFLLFVFLTIVIEGLSRFDANLLSAPPSKIRPETSGVQPAIFGTFWVVGAMIVMVVPLGVGAAVYLEEYADRQHWFNRLTELNIQNLAAVPSIIFGILVLGFVVRGPVGLGAVVLAGSIALTLLILPVVIISTREALRSIPNEIRDGSLALGATRLQTVRRQLLPAAIPGIATGSILGISRAIGEAAPLILIGAATFVTFTPNGLLSRYTVLPVQIYNFILESRAAFQPLAYAAILLLILILLVMNGLAIFLRNKFQQRW